MPCLLNGSRGVMSTPRSVIVGLLLFLFMFELIAAMPHVMSKRSLIGYVTKQQQQQALRVTTSQDDKAPHVKYNPAQKPAYIPIFTL
jgi:hypothetical protein